MCLHAFIYIYIYIHKMLPKISTHSYLYIYIYIYTYIYACEGVCLCVRAVNVAYLCKNRLKLRFVFIIILNRLLYPNQKKMCRF